MSGQSASTDHRTPWVGDIDSDSCLDDLDLLQHSVHQQTQSPQPHVPTACHHPDRLTRCDQRAPTDRVEIHWPQPASALTAGLSPLPSRRGQRLTRCRTTRPGSRGTTVVLVVPCHTTAVFAGSRPRRFVATTARRLRGTSQYEQARGPLLEPLQRTLSAATCWPQPSQSAA
jgi:hypothetical protein